MAPPPNRRAWCLYLSLLVLLTSLISVTQAMMSVKQAQFILNLHNDFRRTIHRRYASYKVNVNPSNMRELEWSWPLAEKAQAHVNKCRYEHFTDGYGQNLFRQTGGDPFFDGSVMRLAMKMWGDDELPRHVKGLKHQNARKDPAIGRFAKPDHATQLLWAKTHAVGCAYQYCPGNTLMFFCNYVQAGNFLRQPWFMHGKSCSRCPSSAPYCRDDLCVASLVPLNTVAPYVSNSNRVHGRTSTSTHFAFVGSIVFALTLRLAF